MIPGLHGIDLVAELVIIGVIVLIRRFMRGIRK